VPCLCKPPGGGCRQTCRAGAPEQARLHAGQGAPWALEAAGGEALPWAHSAAAPAALDAAAAARRGPQPRPILVKGDLRRFLTPPGVDTAPLRIQARLTGALVLHTAHCILCKNAAA